MTTDSSTPKRNCCQTAKTPPTMNNMVFSTTATSSDTSSNAFQDLLGLNKEANADLKNSFYQRQLPSSLVPFASGEGKALFRGSMESNHAEGFFPLTGNFTMQSEPAYCGPSSLAMVLNALEVDPKRIWKGVWRWYNDDMLDCCSPKEEMKKNGITFDEFACLANCHSQAVAKRAPTFSFEEFKQDVKDVTSRSDRFMVISFSRKTLGQTGDGHFSPIGAYNPENDMVLVLDTARYKYPSYWCPIETLYHSMTPADTQTGQPRGYFLIGYDATTPSVCPCKEPTPPQQPPITPRLDWSAIAQCFCKRIPENMWLEKPRSLEHTIEVVLRNVPSEFTKDLANHYMTSSKAYLAQQQQWTKDEEEDQVKDYIRQLLKDTQQSPLYPIVFKTLYPTDQQQQHTVDQQAAFATLFILGSPSMLYTSLPRHVQDTLTSYRQPDHMTDLLKREVCRISQEVKELTKTFCTCGPGWSTPDHSPHCC